MRCIKNSLKLIILIILSIVLISCQKQNISAIQPNIINKAVAVILPTLGYQAQGIVIFTQIDNGVHVNINLTGLTAGKHGFHIHQYGDMRLTNAISAGGHYNPKKMQHSSPSASQHHIGDLGNITANQNGAVVVNYISHSLSLNGATSIIGRSVIVHEGEDDLISQPSGAAGVRIGQGVIGITQ